VVSRIKIMGKLDIADRLRPQDGRARLQVENATLDLRISTVPTREAEKAVIRLLDPRNARRLEALDIAPAELSRIRRLFGHREGIVVVTGPTGSGKTTLLYAALQELATGEVNIMTVEDPVEYELPGLTQIQVETKRDLTFATALRSILRQDPESFQRQHRGRPADRRVFARRGDAHHRRPTLAQ
jgi:general secretion pathway protein E